MRRLGIALLAPGLALFTLGLTAGAASAQGVRITGTTTARYVQLQSVRMDSVPMSETTGDGLLLRQTPDGYTARCYEGAAYCRYYRAGERESTIPLIQDLHATAWGFGEGVRLYTHLRARTGMGSAENLWPQGDRGLELLSAYAELERSGFTARLGRQWLASGLGFYNYDGASVELRPMRVLSADLYGGLSLVRGLNESHTGDVLAAIEDFPPDERAWLLGARMRYRPAPGMAFSAFYQREVRTDKAALYAERVATDASIALGRTAFSGSLEADLATGSVNEARARVDVPLTGSLSAMLEARRYLPFFEMWTIWGAFSPAGFDEASAGLTWGNALSPLTLRLRGGWRSYDDTGTGVGFLPLRDDGWRVSTDVAWRASDRVSLSGDYRAEIGFGAARSEGSLGTRVNLSEGSYLGLSATAFQMAEEFRVQEGTVFGLGLDGGVRLADEMRLAGSVLGYRHLGAGSEPAVDWTQLRGTMRLEWTLGRDPGVVR